MTILKEYNQNVWGPLFVGVPGQLPSPKSGLELIYFVRIPIWDAKSINTYHFVQNTLILSQNQNEITKSLTKFDFVTKSFTRDDFVTISLTKVDFVKKLPTKVDIVTKSLQELISSRKNAFCELIWDEINFGL